MSEDRDLDPIVAAGLGANKGFWMVQLRDRLGQWMKMGQKALMMARISFGLPPFPVRPTYVGPSQRTKGLGRFLVKGKTRAQDRIYHLDPAKLENISAEIPEADLLRQGIKPGPKLDSAGNPIVSRDFSEDDIIDLSQAFSEPATEEDYRLAKATPTAEEQKIIDEERAKSPLAQLPPGAEAKMSEQEVSDLLDGKTAAPAVEGGKEEDYSKLSGEELDELIKPDLSGDKSSQKESLEKSSKALDEAKRRAKLRGEKYSDFTGAPEPTDDLEKAMEQGFEATGPFGFNGYRSRNPEENKEIYDRVGLSLIHI